MFFSHSFTQQYLRANLIFLYVLGVTIAGLFDHETIVMLDSRLQLVFPVLIFLRKKQRIFQ